MPSTIDSLVVTLGLDKQSFDEGRKQVDSDLAKTRENTEKIANEIAAQGERAAAFFKGIRNEAVALFALFTGGIGIAEFIRHTITATAAVGRLAANTGMSVEAMGAWGEAAKRFGGDAQTTQQSIFNLRQDFARFALTGQSEVLPYFRALNVSIADANTGKLRDMSDILIDLSNAVQGLPRPEAHALLAGIGLDEGTINVLLQGGAAVRQLLDHVRALGVANAEEARKAQELQQRWADFTQFVNTAGRNALLSHETEIRQLIDDTAGWIDKNGGLEASLKKAEFATEALFAIWLGGSFVAVLANVTRLVTAFAPLLPFFSILTPLALKGDTGPTDKGMQLGQIAQEQSRAPSFWGGLPAPLNEQTLADQAIQFFMSPEGGSWSRAQASGIAAGAFEESDFGLAWNTNLGAHRGVFQWSPERRAAIEAHFHKRVEDMTATEQYAALAWEIGPGGPESAAGSALRQQTDAGGAGRVMNQRILRPGSQRDWSTDATKAGQYSNQGPTMYLPPLPPQSGFGAGALGGTMSNSVSIGSVNIFTKATDAGGIAKDLKTQLQKYSFLASVNTGLA